jgi:hypothetical protein
MKRMIAIALIWSCVGLVAQTPKPIPNPDEPHSVIPAESLARFFKAQAQLLAAQANLDKATQSLPEYSQMQDKQKAFQGIVNEINTSMCHGSGLTLGSSGDLICNPPKPAAEAKKPEPAKR